MRSIYLDFNSTAPLLPEVRAAMADADSVGYANPASQHAEGRRAHQVLEETREEIARTLGANLTGRQPDRLIFTSGGTEANNLALSVGGDAAGQRLVISDIEHPSITAAADRFAVRGRQLEKLRVTQNGVVDLSHADELLEAPSFATGGSRLPIQSLFSVMLANNETGVIQPVREIARRCESSGVPLHTDAAQAVGKLPINFRELGVAAMTVAPHKFGGPRGIGCLIARHGFELHPILQGGNQQSGLRPGTESLALPIGFLAALKTWERNRESWTRRMAELRDRLEAGTRRAYPKAVINGAGAERLPHTSNIAFIGRNRQALLMALDLVGVCCSTGSACASGSSEPSPTLLAMKLPREVVESSLRFSLGPTTTADDIEEALRRVEKVVRN